MKKTPKTTRKKKTCLIHLIIVAFSMLAHAVSVSVCLRSVYRLLSAASGFVIVFAGCCYCCCLYRTCNYELIFHLDYKSLQIEGFYSPFAPFPLGAWRDALSVCECACLLWILFLPNKRLHALLQSNGEHITFSEVWREPPFHTHAAHSTNVDKK